MLDQQLSGTHVRLEIMQKDHLDGLYAASNDDRIWCYMPMRVSSIEDTERLIAGAVTEYQKGNSVPYTIFNQTTNEIIGSTRLLDIQLQNKNAEIGWTWLSPNVWRTPINTECKFLLLQYCFEELDFIRVQFKTDGRNTRSQEAIARIGAKKEGILRRNRIMYDGYVRDSVYFSILAEEWPAVKANLIERLK